MVVILNLFALLRLNSAKNRIISAPKKSRFFGWCLRMSLRHSLALTVAILLAVCMAANGWAAPKPGPLSGAKDTPGTAAPELIDPLGRHTPQGTVFGFMRAAGQGDYEQALRYLDTRITGLAAQKLITGLRTVLERGFSGNLAMLSNKPEGSQENPISPSRERIGRVKTPSDSLDIFLERVQRGKGPPIWLFSAETLARIPEIQKELDVRTIDSYIPDVFVRTWFLWFPLWQWIVILLLIPLSFGLATVATRLFAPLILSLLRRTLHVRADQHVVRLKGPIRILIFALAIWFISMYSRSLLSSLFWAYVASTLTVIGATWLCVRVLGIVFKLKEKQFAATSPSKISLAGLLEKLSKALTLIIGALVILYIADVNITAAITGLGIGGIAIAFAAQKTLENLFGGIMIISDQPIRVGDFCRAGDHIGTVEAIGLRSTRMRTLERTIVAVPNGQLALMSLENFAMRDKIWFHHSVNLRYETTAEQLRYILAEIRKMLYEHPKVESPSARVRLVGFGNSSLDLEVFAYVLETKYERFLPVQEDLLLRIMDIVEAGGSGFAFPSQTTYLAQDSGLDSAKRLEAIDRVRLWREEGKLPFPDHAPETIAAIENKTEYPPPGSILRNERKE
jgi:MscS family membrane protein